MPNIRPKGANIFIYVNIFEGAGFSQGATFIYYFQILKLYLGCWVFNCDISNFSR